MATKFTPRKRKHFFPILNRELALMQRECKCFQCHLVHHDTLVCKGYIQPTPVSITYELKIVYCPPSAPKVFVITPEIEYSPKIHMYKETKNLCLYYPTESPW